MKKYPKSTWRMSLRDSQTCYSGATSSPSGDTPPVKLAHRVNTFAIAGSATELFPEGRERPVAHGLRANRGGRPAALVYE
jgi:hypothetical protein